MSVRETIEDAVIAWLVAAGAAGGIATPDAKVIVADQAAVRPELPYITVRVLGYDVPVHEDETIVDDDDPPNVYIRGLRTGTVSVNAYGAGAEAWLERATLLLRAPSILAQLEAVDIALRPEGGLNNLSGLLDDAMQVRFQRDFAVDYRRETSETETEAGTPLEQVHHTDEFRDDELDAGTPADFTQTVIEVL